MKKILFLILIFFAGLAFSQVPHTVTFSGNSSDFNSAEQVVGGNNVDYYVTYDGTYLYIGAFRVFGSTWGNFDHFTIYFDTDPTSSVSSGGDGSTTGVNWDSNTPTLPVQADYRVAIRENSSGESFFSDYDDAGSSWSTGTANGQGWTQFADSDALEVRIPWSDIGDPDGIYFLMYCSFNGGFFGASDASYPISHSDSTFTGYFGGIGTVGSGYAPVDVSNQPITEVATTSSFSAGGTYGKVDVNSNLSSGNFTIASGGVLDLTSGTLTIGSNNTVTIQDGSAISENGGTLSSSNGEVSFSGEAAITGTVDFNDVDIAGDVDFGSSSTVNGSLTINSGGAISSNPPTYGGSSELVYNSGGTFARDAEWSSTSGAGYPQDVRVTNSTSINFGAGGIGTAAQCDGNLEIESGSAVFLDFGSDDMQQPLTVKGDFLNNGSFSLSNASGGDLIVEGNFDDNGTFTANGRAVFFEGGNVQNISSTTDPLDIDVMRIGKTGGRVVMNQNLTADATADPLQFSTANSILDLNGNSLTIGNGTTTSQISMVAGSGIRGNSTSTLIINGQGDLGTLRFDQSTPGTTNVLGTFTLDRDASGDVTVENDLTVATQVTVAPSNTLTLNGTLTNNGNLDLQEDANGYGQIIGNVQGTGTVSVQSGLDATGGARWFNVASPFSGGTVADFAVSAGSIQTANGFSANQVNIYYYDPTTADTSVTPAEGTWTMVPNTTFSTDNNAFSLYLGGTFFGGNNNITLTATGSSLNDGAVTIPIDNDNQGYNFVPNPYPSAIDWNTYWDNNSTSLTATYWIDNAGTFEGYDANNNEAFNAGTGTAFIAPMQGFFVQTTADQNLNFTNTHRTVSQTPPKLKTNPSKLVKLRAKAKNAASGDATLVAFRPSYTDQWDQGLDAPKRMNYAAGVPNVYTTGAAGENFVVNNLNEAFRQKIVPMSFQCDQRGVYEIDITTDRLPAGWQVFLEDKLTQTTVDIRNTTYQFGHAVANNPGRFNLIFSQATVDLKEEAEGQNIYAYTSNDNLFLNLESMKGQGKMSLVSLNGATVKTLTVAGGETVQTSLIDLPKGLYILRLSKDGQTLHTQKIIK